MQLVAVAQTVNTIWYMTTSEPNPYLVVINFIILAWVWFVVWNWG